jgi:hypothetical protein
VRPEEVDAIQVKLSQMELWRPRAFGNCWLACEIWRRLKLDRFWSEKLPEGRKGVAAWHKVTELLAVHRLVDPGSEWRLHRQWLDESAMDECWRRTLQWPAKTGSTDWSLTARV